VALIQHNFIRYDINVHYYIEDDNKKTNHLLPFLIYKVLCIKKILFYIIFILLRIFEKYLLILDNNYSIIDLKISLPVSLTDCVN